MAKNIEMQYYNGSSYEVVYPKTNLANVTGTLPIANGGTGATTASAALTNLGALGFVRILTSADDLNNIVQPGIYVYYTDSIPANCPYQNAGVVEVIATNSTTGRLIQRVTRYGVSGQSSMRALDSGTWKDWVAYSMHGHAHAVTDITTGGNLGVRVNASPDITATLNALTLRNIYAKTTDMTAGSTALQTGAVCLIYE